MTFTFDDLLKLPILSEERAQQMRAADEGLRLLYERYGAGMTFDEFLREHHKRKWEVQIGARTVPFWTKEDSHARS